MFKKLLLYLLSKSCLYVWVSRFVFQFTLSNFYVFSSSPYFTFHLLLSKNERVFDYANTLKHRRDGCQNVEKLIFIDQKMVTVDQNLNLVPIHMARESTLPPEGTRLFQT